ncbi:uncharacterized protein LOC111344965 [Stylophora pistillata]|uniref:uncharacterized protein LOC111344965 n=1 Tax=Stylophora pistillata TaxID=50429 RepID=UPI000C04F517|nr:uncharacterized protein LOC111344965 [Stylophora pistillata]
MTEQSSFKFVLQGTVGSGSKGDIAVDDFMVLDGTCTKILKQTSPDCYFEESMCDWHAHNGWVLDTHVAGMKKRVGYASLPAGVSELPSFLSSPIINKNAYEWKCLRFWYLIADNIRVQAHFWRKVSLTVILSNTKTNKTQLLFHAEEATNAVRYVQLPIPVNSIQIQIHFVGVSKFSPGAFLAIDDVSLTKEPCKLIPWSSGKDCQNPLGMENGAIPDEQITASSRWDAHHAPPQGRLHFKPSGVKQGSWSAGVNDGNQWLQVDLGSQYMKVTGVATQGRNARPQWVTKYKLQYSEDGISFQYYKEPGDTEEKEFQGKTNMDSVVFHEVNPFIKARVIRFRPTAWKDHISMRVEVYGCKDDSPCNISQDWCGWKSIRGWKRLMQKDHQDEAVDTYDDKQGDVSDSADSTGFGFFDPENYEIQLPDFDPGYVSFSGISPLLKGFTLCFWIKTSHDGFFIEYKVPREQGESLQLGCYIGNDTLELQLKNSRSKIPTGVVDDMWHHVCVSWNQHKGLMQVFEDGKRKYSSFGFRFFAIEGGGTMTIGFRNSSENASIALGSLSGFNLWGHEMPVEEILHMSFGCGSEKGNVKTWETIRKGLQKEVAVKWFRTCRDRGGGRLVVNTNVTYFNQSAVLVSPLYNRSRDWHSECLKFRYMLRGPGMKALTIYQKTKQYRRIPVWISRRNSGANWLYGQVPLNSLSEFQVSIEGKTETREDLIALTGLYIDKGNLCKHKPWSAKQACSETLTNKSGYFFSPLYPGHSLDDILCRWLISVPPRHIINLQFQEFRLRDHPTCDNCFVEVFDGSGSTGPSLGKFCGYFFPSDLLSSSNHLTILLSCQGNLPVARFKALYRSVSVNENDGLSCSRQQGCPSSCKCEYFGEGKDKKIQVTGIDLLSVPRNLPLNTGAVFFKKNRISQLQQKAFSDLEKLEYIDMSFNILLRLSENCFQNVSSVKTMRLNSNFLRSLPEGVFRGIPNLRVLDLGKNLLQRPIRGMLDGLSTIEVLGLRSNQIERLEYGVFENKSNMTHLYLQDNELKKLPEGLFEDLSELKVLDLSGNKLTTVSKGTFKGLKSLEYL